MSHDPSRPASALQLIVTTIETNQLAQSPVLLAQRLLNAEHRLRHMESTGVTAEIAETVREADIRHRADLAELGQLVADLGAVVLSQQHMIAELTARLDSVQNDQLQVVLQREATREAERVLLNAINAVEGRAEDYEVSIADISTDVEFSTSRATDSKSAERRTTSAESREERDISLGLELKGIAARLAGLKGSVSIDTSAVSKRAEELESTRATRKSESITGRTRTQVRGGSVRKGRK